MNCYPRFEFGAAIFIAWGGSLLDVLGGAMMAASCPRKKHVSKYPSMPSSRSGPPSSTKEYVWARPLQSGSPTEAAEEIVSAPVKSETEGVWTVMTHRQENYWNGTFLYFFSRQAFDNPLIIMQHCQLFHEWCLSPRPNIPQLFTIGLHKYIIIRSPDLMDKPSGCNLLNRSLNGGLWPTLAPPCQNQHLLAFAM